MTPGMLARVRGAIRELDCCPNLMARSLVTWCASTTGVIIAEEMTI